MAGSQGDHRLLSRALRGTVALLVAAGCATAPPPDRVPAGATPVEASPIPEASDARWAGFDRPLARLVRTERGWTELWRTLTRGAAPIPAPPPVDFSNRVVVLLAVEPGHEIDVVRLSRAGDRLFVESVEVEPGPGCPAAPTGEGAVVAFRVERWPGIEGRFLGRVETRSCG